MSRIDELKKQHPNLNVSLIDIVRSIDPTSTYKYLPFLIKMLNNNFDTSPEGLVRALFEEREVNIINKFEEHCKSNRIKNNDISKYSTFEEMETEVLKADEIVKQKDAEKQVHKIYNDDRWSVLIPLTLEASQVYGSNTKWCITQEKYWYEYMWNYKLIFIIDKENNEKYAVSVKYDTKILVQGWPADDKEVAPMLMPIPEDIFSIVLKEVRRPQYETYLEIVGEHSIINSKGQVIRYGDASVNDISFFFNKFSTKLGVDHKNKLKLLHEDKKKGVVGIVEGLKDSNIYGVEENVPPTPFPGVATQLDLSTYVSTSRNPNTNNEEMNQLIGRLRDNNTSRRLLTPDPIEDSEDEVIEDESEYSSEVNSLNFPDYGGDYASTLRHLTGHLPDLTTR